MFESNKQHRVKWLLFILFAITSSTVGAQIKNLSTSALTEGVFGRITISGTYKPSKSVVFEKEVIILPSAYIQTSGADSIVFKGKVTIIGTSQVFDVKANIRFYGDSFLELNPTWFGADGRDDIDDTQAFLTTLKYAHNSARSINIKVPQGRYIISKTLELKARQTNENAINLIGEIIGGSSISGTCLQWHGKQESSLLVISNNTNARIENLEFACYSTTSLKHNLELLPFIHQLHIENCFFSGCSGAGAANVNLNKGNNAQVSEISFQNCTFRGYTLDNITWLTESAVIGGLANTKNFYFDKCSFLGYSIAAINIDISDIVQIRNCSFSVNRTDISCGLCGSFIVSNYSEQSKTFFKSGTSANTSFTTIMNNYFDGNEKEDYVISEGSGNLVLINNSFGGTSYDDQVNKINWSGNVQSSITSISNFYRNVAQDKSPFYIDKSRERSTNVISIQDQIGKNGQEFKRINIGKN